MPKDRVMSLGNSLAKITEAPHTNHQLQEFQAETEERRRSRELIMREVLYDLPDDDRERLIDVAVEQRVLILSHAGSIKRHVYEIGRALNTLKSKLPGTSMTRLLSSYDRNEREGTSHESALPFSNTTASKFMAIATAIDSRAFHQAFEGTGRQFAIEMLPDYSATYYLTMLDDDALAEAARNDVIRPDLTVREAMAVKSKYNPSRRAAAIADSRELEKINREIKRHTDALAALELRRRAIMARLGPDNFSTWKSGGSATVIDGRAKRLSGPEEAGGEDGGRGMHAAE